MLLPDEHVCLSPPTCSPKPGEHAAPQTGVNRSCLLGRRDAPTQPPVVVGSSTSLVRDINRFEEVVISLLLADTKRFTISVATGWHAG
jgi:hypothetical protein